MRPAAPSSAGGRGLSRFPYKMFPCMSGASDRAEPAPLLRWRLAQCCLPLDSSTSALWSRFVFRGSIPNLHAPRSTLRPGNCSPVRKTWGQRGSLDLHCSGLSPYDTLPVLTGAPNRTNCGREKGVRDMSGVWGQFSFQVVRAARGAHQTLCKRRVKRFRDGGGSRLNREMKGRMDRLRPATNQKDDHGDEGLRGHGLVFPRFPESSAEAFGGAGWAGRIEDVTAARVVVSRRRTRLPAALWQAGQRFDQEEP